MNNCRFFPVGGTGGGPTAEPFRIELWRHIFDFVGSEKPKVALLTTPSKRSSGAISLEAISINYKDLGSQLGCTFVELAEEEFGRGEYDGQFDVLCITCGNTQGAREEWAIHGCEATIRNWYEGGVVVTGYSAGFISFFEWASTDSVPGPNGAEFGVMQCMGLVAGGAVPHVDTQPNRIPDFQRVLATQSITPVLALGEDAMAEYLNGEFVKVVSPVKSAMAGWVEADTFVPIDVEILETYNS